MHYCSTAMATLHNKGALKVLVQLLLFAEVRAVQESGTVL
jgi:hypothetical protein